MSGDLARTLARDLEWDAIQCAARKKLDEERHRAAVDAAKQFLQARRWWHRLFPYTITITRRKVWP